MSLSIAQKSVALMGKVLDLSLTEKRGDCHWRIWIGKIAIDLCYCLQSDELQISHQLASFKNAALSDSDLEDCALFSERYLKRRTHWIECNLKENLMVLRSRIHLADDNDYALSVEVPCFAQLCSFWKEFIQRADMSHLPNCDKSKINPSPFAIARRLPLQALALCESHDLY